MDKPTSLCSDHNTATSSTTTVSPPPSPIQCYHQDLTTDFSSMYNFIFSPKSTLPRSLSITPSSCSSSDDLKLVSGDNIAAAASTENRLNQARLVLEYQQMCDHFDLCFSRLQALKGEVETLRRENSDLRVANNELIKLVSLSSRAAINNRNLQCEKLLDLNEKIRQRGQKKLLTKSASFESRNSLKFNQQQRVINPQPPVYVPSMAKKEENPIEMDVYNQGMVKTEICNKWQETGICPYGDHCQFAHGIAELRPVIRHPRYKTQVCRMVLSGEACPYGHRCHFRHCVTEKEQLSISP